jgi:hypothetical protein
VSFTAPSNTGAAPVTSYTVTSTPGNISATGASSPVSVPALSFNQTYTFTVVANNSAGTSTASSASNTVTISNGSTLSGGQPYSDATYYYRVFRSNGSLVVGSSPLVADILVIAGGGAGAYGYAGGGGAGGLVYLTNQTLSIGTFSATVGAGGNINTSTYNEGQDGSPSQFGSLTPIAVGGGGGAIYGNAGHTGGSGGGGGYSNGPGGSGTAGQGNNGSGYSQGGGGGGAGGGGSGNNGGPGSSAYSSWGAATFSGVNYLGTYYYAAGGDSEVSSDATYGKTPGYTAAPANTGNGSGGNCSTSPSGGSGIIIVRVTRTQILGG